VVGVLLVGLAVLSAMSWLHDARNDEYQTALAEGLEQAERARQLAQAPEGIPPTGALSLLRTDPKTQGPNLCQKQCTICHNYGAPKGKAITAEKPLAPELYGFAGRAWLTDFMDPKQIASPKYFGNTRFAAGIMVRYVEGKFSKLPKAEQEAIIAALSAEAQLPSQQEQDAADRSAIEQGRQLIVQRKCTRCHRFHEEGFLGSAPDLTGYGSQEWVMGILIDPTHDWFYGPRNDRMPAYLEVPEAPEKNRLTAGEVELMADWLRADWYEPKPNSSGQPQAAERPKRKPPLLTVATWAHRRAAPEPTPDTPQAKARALYLREHCAICHDCTSAPGGDVVAADPSAPDLGGFASRQWIAGLLDPKQIKTRKYFGNSAFRSGDMADFVEETFSDLDDQEKKEIESLVMALSAEAQLPGQREIDQRDADRIQGGREMLGQWGCTDCHRFHDSPGTGAPNLTGYGSQEWTAAILSDPSQKRFYGDENDGMPSYHMFPDEPQKNLLTEEEIGLLADWIRGAVGGDDGRKKTD
jgi:ubiquinol-cytochrome c reductase cytochrome b subunit